MIPSFHIKQLLILAGETYCQRLWTMYDIFVPYMNNNNNLIDKIVIIPLEYEDSVTDVMSNFGLLSLQHCICLNPNDEIFLHTLFAAVGKTRFEESIHKLANDIIDKSCRIQGGLKMRIDMVRHHIQLSKKALRIPPRTHVFLTHNWANDNSGRNNHDRVSYINNALKAKGLITWFDSDRLIGEIRQQMTDGIDNTLCMIVFITSCYESKVNGHEQRDHCHYEFNYAVNILGPQKMIAVVMEKEMRKTWTKALGGALNSKLYIDMSDDFGNMDAFNTKIEEIYNNVAYVIGDPIPQLV